MNFQNHEIQEIKKSLKKRMKAFYMDRNEKQIADVRKTSQQEIRNLEEQRRLTVRIKFTSKDETGFTK